MKHEPITLLLAAEVRRLAQEMRQAALTNAASDSTRKYQEAVTTEEAEAARAVLGETKARWLAVHTLDEFIPKAAAAIEHVADLISRPSA